MPNPISKYPQLINGYLGNLFAFLPLLAFVMYALWDGTPTPNRWIAAYKVAAPIAAGHLLIILLIPKPVNRLVLGANLYLLIGGTLAWLALWKILKFYGDFLRESGVLLPMVVVGAISTFLTPSGFVGHINVNTASVRRYSYVLLVVAILGFVISFLFRGHRFLGAAIPIMALAITNRILVDRLRRQNPI